MSNGRWQNFWMNLPTVRARHTESIRTLVPIVDGTKCEQATARNEAVTENYQPVYFEYVEGDLISMAKNGEFDLIFHGANCMNTMGSGIAGQVNTHFTAAWAADQKTRKGSLKKLGTYTSAEQAVVEGKARGQMFTVANLYTQYGYGTDFPRFSLSAFMSSLSALFEDVYDPSIRIGFPMIGAGLGGGNWNEIAAMYDNVIDGLNKTAKFSEYMSVGGLPPWRAFDPDEDSFTKAKCVVLKASQIPGQRVIS